MRVLLHAQHLSGVGHHVRALELARALATAHEVFMLDGGAPVPRAPIAGRFVRVALPGLRRGPTGLEPLAGGSSLANVLARRTARAHDVAVRLAPDVVLVEHYPFSKWELEGEVLALLDGARPHALAVASVRDIPRQTRHEAVAPAAYRARVAATLAARFDVLLVHGDARVTRLADHFADADALPIPVFETGYVVEPPPPRVGAPEALLPRGGRYAVASAGGDGELAFLAACVDAWRRRPRDPRGDDRPLLVFAGVGATDADLESLRRRAGDAPVIVSPFREDFVGALAGADLSISRAGYNTCAALLATRRRAVLVPDPRMSDQLERARRFEALALAVVVARDELDAGALDGAIEAALGREAPRHDVALDGANEARRVIEACRRAGPRSRA